MSFKDQNITGFDRTAAVNALIFGNAAPTIGGQISLLHTGVIKAPINKARAVELVGTLCSQYIPAPKTGFCSCNQGRNTTRTTVMIISTSAATTSTRLATTATVAIAGLFIARAAGTAGRSLDRRIGEQFMIGRSTKFAICGETITLLEDVYKRQEYSNPR